MVNEVVKDEMRENFSAWKPDYQAEIVEIIRSSQSPAAMCDRLSDYHENDLADVLPQLSLAERIKLYRVMDVSMLSGIFAYMDEEDASHFLNEMDIRKAAALLFHMEADGAVEILRKIDKEKRTVLIDLMDEAVRRDVALIASFGEDEIGSRMTTNYIVIREKLTVKQAMDALIEQAVRNDNISTVFVEGENQTFYGVIDLKELITAGRDTDLQELIMTSYPYVYGTETIEDCIERLKGYSEDLIPVLDHQNHMIGVITSQNVIRVVDEEMGEDYAMFAGLTAEEDLHESLKDNMKKRIPWLLVLLALGTMVSSVVGIFEQVVSQLTLIMCFQSLILDMAGNVGTQSLAVTIRVLMDESLTARQKLGLVGKETRVGFCNGAILGVVLFGVIGLYISLFKGRNLMFSFVVSGCIGMSLLAAMVISSVVGTVIPLFFKKIHVDPAVASGPLITTVNDLVAVVTYYGLSWILLIRLMHMEG